jgi:sulfur-carrier protein
MQVLIPTSLRSYTGLSSVEATGATLGDVLSDMDRQFPGVRFRMIDEQDQLRPNMRVFVDGKAIRDLAQPLWPSAKLSIVQALSGG